MNDTTPTVTPRIVVLTPVRNESWILRRFFEVTCCFADHIIVAYQESSDDTLDICRDFPRVTVVENPSPDFNEAERQLLLINEARRLVPGPKILLALDADDILAHSSISSDGWTRMKAAAPGTVLHFRTVDLLPSTRDHIAYDHYYPLGYVDDGAAHVPRAIHSTRIPVPAGAKHLSLDDVCVVHYALTRPDACAAKLRYYSVIENLLGTSHVLQRRRNYPANHDWISALNLKREGGRVDRTPPEWLGGWEATGTDMRTILTEDCYWHDLAVLRLLQRHGARRFWFDNIWDVDWDRAGKKFALHEDPHRQFPVRPPPTLLRKLGRGMDRVYDLYVASKTTLRNRK